MPRVKDKERVPEFHCLKETSAKLHTNFTKKKIANFSKKETPKSLGFHQN